MKRTEIFTSGIIRNNPLLVLMIGLCSSLAVTTNVLNGLGMGAAMTFVIFMSELIISIFRKAIPKDIRIPVFIIVIASFTTIVDLLMQAFTPELSESMGIFIKLIVVNCIIMGRVEAFASKETPGKSILDALGMGIGYTWVLAAISLVREVLGSGSVAGIQFIPEELHIKFFANPPGGFFVFGLFISINAGLNGLSKFLQTKKKLKKTQDILKLQAVNSAEEAEKMKESGKSDSEKVLEKDSKSEAKTSADSENKAEGAVKPETEQSAKAISSPSAQEAPNKEAASNVN